MCDLAPRERYDFNAAIREANKACTGLFTPVRVIVSDTVMLISASPSSSGEGGSAPAQSFPDDQVPRAGVAAAARNIMEGGR